MLPRRDVPLPWGGQLLRSLESPEAKHLEAMAKEQVPKCRFRFGGRLYAVEIWVGWLVGWSIWVGLVGWILVWCACFFWKIKRASWECVLYCLWYAQVKKWLETTCLLKQIASNESFPLSLFRNLLHIVKHHIYSRFKTFHGISNDRQRKCPRQLQTSKASWRIARCGEISCKRVLDGHTKVSSTQKLERKRWLWGLFFSRLPPIFLGGKNHPKMGQLRLVPVKSWGTLVALSQFLREVGTIYCHFAV